MNHSIFCACEESCVSTWEERSEQVQDEIIIETEI